MPAKRGNVLSQLLCVFKAKKAHGEDIVTLADKVVRDYIYAKNKFIRRKYKKANKALWVASLLLFSSLVLTVVAVNMI